MTRDNIIELMENYNIEKISEDQWKLDTFIFYFINNTITVSGYFIYSLAKQICSEEFYSTELFVSPKEKNVPFETFLTSYEINFSLSGFSTDCATFFNFDFDTYNEKYNTLKKELLEDTISKEGKEKLFLENIHIVSIPALIHTIECIKNFYA